MRLALWVMGVSSCMWVKYDVPDSRGMTIIRDVVSTLNVFLLL